MPWWTDVKWPVSDAPQQGDYGQAGHSVWILHDEQEVAAGGAVRQSYVEVSTGMNYVDPTFLHLTFQAGLLINERQWKEEEEEEPLEPLNMEHFYFPLILWSVGLILSTVSFIVEIIIKRCQRNDQL